MCQASVRRFSAYLTGLNVNEEFISEKNYLGFISRANLHKEAASEADCGKPFMTSFDSGAAVFRRS